MHNTQAKQEELAHNFLRRKTIGNVKKEILELKKLYSPEFLYFVDDSFLARPKKEIFDFMDLKESYFKSHHLLQFVLSISVEYIFDLMEKYNGVYQ